MRHTSSTSLRKESWQSQLVVVSEPTKKGIKTYEGRGQDGRIDGRVFGSSAAQARNRGAAGPGPLPLGGPECRRARTVPGGRGSPSVRGAGPGVGPVQGAARRPRVAGVSGRAGPLAPKMARGRTAGPVPLCGGGGRNLHLLEAAVSAGLLCYRAEGQRGGACGLCVARALGPERAWRLSLERPVRPGGAGRVERGCFAGSRHSGPVALWALCDGGIRVVGGTD
ncbi:hypothetical protein NDU88_003935 [Pleurodeles waltl]|uniref:Uncharacterized protein n=1 Tax=Pleurodeles waltl TaxID=8319 RepID=A0AAV7RGM5_PLEWA|nr:hypothetical protein NDU88_003935 [Pleurodeles waltl]